ncbi:MAG TPA: hypothetical protein VGM20_10025 [Gemmatimonadales bacterium]|jgi:hypothetical protein
MSEPSEYTRTSETRTETKRDSGGSRQTESKDETTVRTERTVKEEKEKDPIVIIQHDDD